MEFFDELSGEHEGHLAHNENGRGSNSGGVTSGENYLNEDIVTLQRLWRNELNCVEILPYERQLVDDLNELLQQQQAIVEQKASTPDEIFTSSLYHMDIERVRYSLSKYLRVRLIKIEKMFLYILSNLELMERLSKDEKIFLTKLSNLHQTYYDETFYHRLSTHIKDSITNSDDILKHSQISFYVSLYPPPPPPHPFTDLFTTTPHQNTWQGYVFCRVLRDISQVDTGDGIVQNFFQGEMFIAKYIVIREYLLNNQLELL